MAMPQDLASPERADVSVFFDRDETVVRLVGQVDLALAEGLDFAAGQAIERGSPVRVDVSGVTFLDSTGLSLIARLAAFEREGGRRLRVEGFSRLMRELFEVAGLSAVLDQLSIRVT
jgi:anti-sigma B factor antagonist